MVAASTVLLAGIVAMLFQTTIFPALPLPVVPDLILVLTVYLAVRHQGLSGAAGAFCLGYFLDAFSGVVLGINAFALTAVYGAVYLVARHLWTEGGFPIMAMAFLGGWVRVIATAVASSLVETPAGVWQHVLGYGVWEAIAAALVAPAVFAFVGWERRLFGLA
jgi:rod shape-determining protein MreD